MLQRHCNTWYSSCYPSTSKYSTLQACATHDIAARIRYLGETAEEAGRDIMKKIDHMGGQGGLIIIDQKGQVAMPFNTEGMYRGTIGADGIAQVSIYKD